VTDILCGIDIGQTLRFDPEGRGNFCGFRSQEAKRPPCSGGLRCSSGAEIGIAVTECPTRTQASFNLSIPPYPIAYPVYSGLESECLRIGSKLHLKDDVSLDIRRVSSSSSRDTDRKCDCISRAAGPRRRSAKRVTRERATWMATRNCEKDAPTHAENDRHGPIANPIWRQRRAAPKRSDNQPNG
jgi:hypothetical protein